MENKRLKILVGVNTLTVIDQAVYANHCQFWFRLGRQYQDIDFAFYTPRRSSIDRMRNELGRLAVANGFDYLLFIDDDVMIPFDGLGKLLKADADIAAGWTIIRGWPYDNMFFKYLDEEKQSLSLYRGELKLNEKGLVECDAVGFSFCLLKVSHMKKVPPPYFVTGPYNTEDVYYCIKASKHVPETTIVVDPTVKTSHCLGSEFIDPDTRDKYKDYFKAMYPEIAKEEAHLEARGDGYLAMIEDPGDAEKTKKHLDSGN